MKILKQLNRLFLILVLSTVLIQTTFAEVKITNIWKTIETKKTTNENFKEDVKIDSNKIQGIKIKLNDDDIIVNNELDESKELLAGLFDPADNDLNLNMWTNSNGSEVKNLLKKLNSKELSSFSKKIMDIALLTNSYLPESDISSKEFLNFTIEHLLNIKDYDLIKKFVTKNPEIDNKEKLVRVIVDYHLSNFEIEKSCNFFKNIDLISDEYLDYFKIYCLINENQNEQAQLLFDLKSEVEMLDDFFVKKFEVLMGYEESNYIVSDDNMLYFHLSHKTDKNFVYLPQADSPEFIWNYFSNSNLFENLKFLDLKNIEQIKFMEKATNEEIFDEKELLNLYKKFSFDIDNLLNAKEYYKTLVDYEGRALLYQRLLLADNLENKLDISSKLKKSFDKANLPKAFDEELSYMLKKMEERENPTNFLTFYTENKEIKKNKKLKIKFNNKVLHQSKAINYFQNKTSLKKTEKIVNDTLKKIKKNKKYSFSSKDILMLESLKSDGIKISEENANLYEYNSQISPEIKSMIENEETGLILLKIVEIIGENEIENLDRDTLSYVVEIMSELKLINLRNELLLKVLPLKV